jgi:hypothetical protein
MRSALLAVSLACPPLLEEGWNKCASYKLASVQKYQLHNADTNHGSNFF